jgi:hypothetical protein
MDLGHLTWRKSSYTSANGGNCVEVAHVPQWRKASYSGAQGGNCVEVADFPGASIAVRDSKDPDGPKLLFSLGEWRAFISGIKAGELGLG